MALTLDRIDHQIVDLLQADARMTNRELARRIQLAPSTALTRVQRLIDGGVLTGFGARVDPAALGLNLEVVVFVQLRSHDRSDSRAFIDEVLDRPEVVQLFYVGGAQDLVVHVVVRDTDDLRRVVLEGIASHPLVSHIETNLVFEHRRRPIRAPAREVVPV
ncbi:MAG: Lrp/AsnC family transcriptional regulator [Myxococcota bacterium]